MELYFNVGQLRLAENKSLSPIDVVDNDKIFSKFSKRLFENLEAMTILSIKSVVNNVEGHLPLHVI